MDKFLQQVFSTCILFGLAMTGELSAQSATLRRPAVVSDAAERKYEQIEWGLARRGACGIEALYVVARMCGRSVELQELERMMGLSPNGNTLYELQECATKIGINTELIKCNEVEQMLTQRPPVIAQLRFIPIPHLVVITAIQGERVEYIEPTEAKLISMPGERFFKEKATGYVLRLRHSSFAARGSWYTLLAGLLLGFVGIRYWFTRRGIRKGCVMAGLVLTCFQNNIAKACDQVEGSAWRRPENLNEHAVYLFLRANGMDAEYDSVHLAMRQMYRGSLEDLRDVIERCGLPCRIVECKSRSDVQRSMPAIMLLNTVRSGPSIILLYYLEGRVARWVEPGFVTYAHGSWDGIVDNWSGFVLTADNSRSRDHRVSALIGAVSFLTGVVWCRAWRKKRSVGPAGAICLAVVGTLGIESNCQGATQEVSDTTRRSVCVRERVSSLHVSWYRRRTGYSMEGSTGDLNAPLESRTETASIELMWQRGRYYYSRRKFAGILDTKTESTIVGFGMGLLEVGFDGSNYFVGSKLDTLTEDARNMLLIAASSRSKEAGIAETTFEKSPLYYAGWTIPGIDSHFAGDSNGCDATASRFSGYQLIEMQDDASTGRRVAVYEGVNENGFRTRAVVDPSRQYSCIRYEEHDLSGKLIRQATCEDFRSRANGDLELWFPQRARVDYYSWPWLVGEPSDKIQASDEYELIGLDFGIPTDDQFVVSYSRVGSILSFRPAGGMKKSIYVRYPADQRELDQAIVTSGGFNQYQRGGEAEFSLIVFIGGVLIGLGLGTLVPIVREPSPLKDSGAAPRHEVLGIIAACILISYKTARAQEATVDPKDEAGEIGRVRCLVLRNSAFVKSIHVAYESPTADSDSPESYSHLEVCASVTDELWADLGHGNKYMDWSKDPDRRQYHEAGGRMTTTFPSDRTRYSGSVASVGDVRFDEKYEHILLCTGIWPFEKIPSARFGSGACSSLRDVAISSDYRLRSQHEIYDGRECWVLEWPNHDHLWLDCERRGALVARVIDDVPEPGKQTTINLMDMRRIRNEIYFPFQIVSTVLSYRALRDTDNSRGEEVERRVFHILSVSVNEPEVLERGDALLPGTVDMRAQGKWADPIQVCDGGEEVMDQVARCLFDISAIRRHSVDWWTLVWQSAVFGFACLLLGSLGARTLWIRKIPTTMAVGRRPDSESDTL